MISWGVFRVYDSGRAELVKAARSATHADLVAGAMRDRMTDAQVGEAVRAGWNYLPRRMSAQDRARAKVRNFVANNRTSYQSRTQHKIAALTKRLGRKGAGRTT